MYMMKKVYFLILIVLLTQCKKENVTDRCTCPDNSVCTMEFVFLTIKVKDTDGNPFMLDQYFTIDSTTRDTLYIKSLDGYIDSVYKAEGSYPILTDEHLNYTQKCGGEFEFIGLKNNLEVVRKSFNIRNDCCHVKWSKGYDDIVVD